MGPGPLRVAVCGAGKISPHHLIAWARAGATVAAICDPDRVRAAARASEFGIPAVFADAETMLAQVPADILDVAARRETHRDLVWLAAERGLPVLCQKPLAPTLAEAQRLVAEVGGRVRLMVHENWRFRPYYRAIRSHLDAGLVGAVQQVAFSVRSSEYLPDESGACPALEERPFLRSEPRLLVAETLIHHIDVARWLFGPLSVVAAHLCGAAGIAGETAATLVLRRADGLLVVIEASKTAFGYPRQAADRLEVLGTAGRLLLERNRLQFSGLVATDTEYDHPVAYQAAFDAAVAHFVGCLRSGARFETDPEDNLATLALVEEVYRVATRAPPPENIAPGDRG